VLATAKRRIDSVLQRLGSLLPRRAVRTDSRRIIRPWREDSLHNYPSVGITPSAVLRLLQAADGGQPQLQFELFREMLQKWPRLVSVEATRRLALTGLEWEIVPDDGGSPGARGSSQQAADFVRETLGRLDRFRDVLEHFATAIGFGVSVAELVWEDGRLIDIVPVPYTRLTADPNEPWRLRVRTQAEPNNGIPLDEQPFKWAIHQPEAQPGHPFEGGLLRASALLYLAQNLSFKDWLIWSQIAGMPVRVARFEPGTPEEDKRQLLKMLESLGTDAVAIFSKNVELQFVESTKGGEKPYKALQDHCNIEITILWLGQHLTTDIRQSGSRAAAEIHDRVREDLLVADISDESETIRRDVLTPIVRARLGDRAPVPRFRRSLIQSVDTKVLADTLAVAVRDLGVRPPRRWVHRALGIPEPVGDEAVLSAGSGS
jgi:phage gp29-like protein